MEEVAPARSEFSPALNMLATPTLRLAIRPGKAGATLEAYANCSRALPHPEDSLGEVLRMTGDDRGSLEHYSAGLQIDPTYFSRSSAWRIP